MKRTGFALRKPPASARLGVPVFKPKTCKVCKQRFTPTKRLQTPCSIKCAIDLGAINAMKLAAKAAAEERREDRARKEKLKTRSDYTKEAQREFNKFIRTRDAQRPCICCGRPLQLEANGGGFDSGHYRSVGSAPHLRFNEANAHGQTKQCNRWGAGRAIDYRRGLIDRIGLAAVEVLEADQAPKHYTIEDLKAIKAEFRAKARTLEKT